jgi:Ca2+-binding EF-hand superfamily protein
MLPAVAGFAANAASQILSSLLSALDPTTSASSASSTSSSTSGNATFACGDDSDAASPNNSLTGSTQGQISGQVLMTLIAMQQQSGATSGTTGASATSGTTSNSPLDQLLSAMDTNGDGSVSQTEMESYIENLGGTQGEADALYRSLSQIGSTSSATAASSTSSTGISESQMQSALQQSNPFSGMGHHHHHHHGMSASNSSSDPADQVANNLIQAMDTNDDGSVSEDEFTSFMTANGGSTSDAQSDFASLDTSGSLTSADFAKAWESWQAQQSSQSSGTMMASLLDNFAKANGASAASATTSLIA